MEIKEILKERYQKSLRELGEEHIVTLMSKLTYDDYLIVEKEVIDKACEWLNESLYPTVKTNFDNVVEVQSTQEFLILFKKVMEE